MNLKLILNLKLKIRKIYFIFFLVFGKRIVSLSIKGIDMVCGEGLELVT